MDKDLFLGNVRSALNAGGREHKALTPKSDDFFRDAVYEIERRSDVGWERLYQELQPTAERMGWKVSRVDGPEDVLEYMEGLITDLGAENLAITVQDSISDVDVQRVSDACRVSITKVSRGLGIDDQELRERVIKADIGITGVEYAVAETGTCVISSDSQTGRLVGLAPPVHVVLVRRGQVVESLDDLFAIRRLQFAEGSMPVYTNLISGPSRTADIEYTLVTGVHGPGDVHMLLLD